MPYKGGTNGGGEGGGLHPLGGGMYGDPDLAYGSSAPNRREMVKPTLEKTKSVSYNATTSNQILSLSGDPSSTATKDSIPKAVEVRNIGDTPLFCMFGYREWTADTTDAGSGEGTFEYLHIMLLPNQVFIPPTRGIIRTGETDGTESKVMLDGTVADNAVPDGNMYVDIASCYIDGAGLASGTTATTFNVDNNAGSPAAAVGFFRVGDLLRIENEILEITAIAANTGTEAQLTVKRGMFGSTAATHADNTQLRMPFFNAYHDFDKFSVCQTDWDGKFKAMNLFGVGRANSGVTGIVPGSLAIKFYEAGYQALGLSGITAGTNSGLAVSTAYALDIQVDGGTNFDNLTFTTDSANVNFGGANGIVAKLQDALDTQFYTSGNLFEKRVHVAIVNGDIRFTSGSHLSTSAIALTAEDGSDASFFGTGRIPAIGNIRGAVAAKLPDDVSYDSVTYTTSPNQVFAFDNGSGRIMGACSGTINYETGAITLNNCLPNAQFVYSVCHTSAFSGKLTEGTDERINSLVDIYANTVQQKKNGKIRVRTF